MTEITLVVNGAAVGGEVEPRTHLADFLREKLQLTATHLRCEQGVCGACTLLIDGEPARSCITYAVSCQGAEVTTLEGLEQDPIVEQLREAFSVEHGLQCGFCTPGMLVTARDIISRLPESDAARVRVELSGNLCRCTGYVGIVRAICRVLEDRRGAPIAASSTPRLGPVGARHLAGAQSLRAQAPRAPEPSPPDASLPSDGDVGLGSRQPNLETAISFKVGRPAAEVWAALDDIERVARCMPGASLTEPPDQGKVKGRVAIKVGPITTSFGGAGLVVREEAFMKGVFYGAGRDRLSGSSARAEVAYALSPEGERATQVNVTIRALLAGPLAQFGRSSIVQDLVGRLAVDFARRLEHSLATGEEAPSSQAALRPGALLVAALTARIRAALGRLVRKIK